LDHIIHEDHEKCSNYYFESVMPFSPIEQVTP